MNAEEKNLHHANLLLGTPEEAELYLKSLCENLGVTIANNPDFFSFRMDIFGIDNARELRLLSLRKALTDRKIFFISSIQLTPEAQNALLKTFEDPPSNTHFFLTAREESVIEPTLLSRMRVIKIRSNLVKKDLTLFNDARKFLSLSVKDRLLFAKEFVDKEKNIIIFLDDLISFLTSWDKKGELLKKVYNIRRLINDSVASRLIIEHLSLVL